MPDKPPTSEKYSALLMIFVTVVLSFWLRGKYPDARNILPYLMVIIGVPLMVGASTVTARYREVFDYEPAQFLGRETNGLKIRTFLRRCSLAGGWLIVLGIILFIIR